jgi:N-acetylglucosaminyldiphosphoundecaprenol N-acetyl-beta-D-mannosaminyltransferase
MNYPRITEFNVYKKGLENLPNTKLLISTINAHSYNVACEDGAFHNSLQASQVLLPDGISIVLALRILTGEKIKKIAGADLFFYEMERLNQISGKAFFLGSTNAVLKKISNRAAQDFPNVSITIYSPPYKPEFSIIDNEAIVKAINEVQPDVLFIGMTAPKQEKWAYQHFDKLAANHIGCIGAVFDFYAGEIKRAPAWVVKIGFEWCYRLFSEPKRLWKRYLLGNLFFIQKIIKEKLSKPNTIDK